MVSVAPLAIVTLAVTRYGPLAAVQVLLPASVPLTLCTLPSSYHTSTVLRVSSTLPALYDRTCTRLMPGSNPAALPAFGSDQAPVAGVYAADTPLTFTDCVAAESAIPLNVTDAGLVVVA